MGSRYGGMKQIDSVWPSGECLMEYSLYDAIRAWFDTVVCVIRKEFLCDFRERFWYWEEIVHMIYVDQPVYIDWLPLRSKPWWTWHAVLVAKDVINQPFVVVYADDYCGSNAFEICWGFLDQMTSFQDCALLGFPLANTLSPHGGVNRGVCQIDDNGYLLDMKERLAIEQWGQKAYFPLPWWWKGELALDCVVSMGCFCFQPQIFDLLEQGFVEFVRDFGHVAWSEYFLTSALDEWIGQWQVRCSVLKTQDRWYWLTNKDDKARVVWVFEGFVNVWMYPSPLSWLS